MEGQKRIGVTQRSLGSLIYTSFFVVIRDFGLSIEASLINIRFLAHFKLGVEDLVAFDHGGSDSTTWLECDYVEWIDITEEYYSMFFSYSFILIHLVLTHLSGCNYILTTEPMNWF